MVVKKHDSDVCVNVWLAPETRDVLRKYAGMRGLSLHTSLRVHLERLADKAREVIPSVPELGVEVLQDYQVLSGVGSGQVSAAIQIAKGHTGPMREPVRVHLIQYKTAIKRNVSFEQKGLAKFSVNVGLKCGHDCTYCSTGAVFSGPRTPPAFKLHKVKPSSRGYAMVDPSIAERIAKDAKCHRKNRGLVQVCTTTDAWAPECQHENLGRKICEGILREPDWSIRVLTKNAAVREEFDLFYKYKDRVIVGISITAGLKYAAQTSAIEPWASGLEERLATMQKAHRMGLRTYAMLCPVMPYCLDSVEEMVEQAIAYGAEEFFSEAVNPRGKGLAHTVEALAAAGFISEAEQVRVITTRRSWSSYCLELYGALTKALRKHKRAKDLRFLCYESSFDAETLEKAKRMKDQTGIIWLRKV